RKRDDLTEKVTFQQTSGLARKDDRIAIFFSSHWLRSQMQYSLNNLS
ncbi:unnamed protein product, partial [Adineta steineri]